MYGPKKIDYLCSDIMTNVYTEWVNVVHFCNSWPIWFILAGGGGPPPGPPPPLPPPLKQRPGLGPGFGGRLWQLIWAR